MSTQQTHRSKTATGWSLRAPAVRMSGNLTERQGDVMLAWGESILGTLAWSKADHKRAMRCLIEWIQNLSKHAGYATLSIGVNDAGALMMDSTNEVDSHLLSELKLALEKALSPPIEEMKGARLDRLANGHRTAAGGAGLGLMDLRILSENNLRAECLPCDGGGTALVLTVTVHPKSN